VSAPLESGTAASSHTLPTPAADGTATPPQEAETPGAGSTQEGASAEDSATIKMGPFTTFQQLSFAPHFPLASIANEYIIPPTYASFLEYRAEHEAESTGESNVDLATIQFTPPGLPLPSPIPPSRWFYRDPKGVVHGKHRFINVETVILIRFL
jgi:hypothetical protein